MSCCYATPKVYFESEGTTYLLDGFPRRAIRLQIDKDYRLGDNMFPFLVCSFFDWLAKKTRDAFIRSTWEPREGSIAFG